MSIFKSLSQYMSNALGSSQPASTTHLTRSERTMRSDVLGCAMSAPEAARRYAVYQSMWR